MTLGFFGLVTSTAVTFFGCDSWAIHSTRRRSRVSWMAMPSPQLPKPSRGWWASSRIVGIGSHLSLGLTTAPMLSSAHMRRAVVLAGLLVALATAAAAQSRPLAVRLAIHTSLMGAPDVIAVRQGYFKQEGLDVEWRRFALGKEGRDAMSADAKDRVPSMVAKAVDMAALGDPFVAIAEHEGLIRPLEDFCRYDVMPFMLTATNRIVQENPASVVAYLRGWLRAVRLLKEEPEK